MASTIKLKNGSGAPLAGDLVQAEPALDLTNKRLYTEDSGGNVIEVGINPSSLTIGGTALTATAAELNTLDGITATTAELNTLDGITATVTELNYTDGVTSNIQTQLNTKAPIASPTFTGTVTAPAVNVNGTVTADGLTVDGSGLITNNATTDQLTINNNTAGSTASPQYVDVTFNGYSTYNRARIRGVDRSSNTTSGGLIVQTAVDNTTLANRIFVDGNGDISFYEDTGTTAKFFWDASGEVLGIGHSTPSATYGIDVSGKAIRVSAAAPAIEFQETDAANQRWSMFSIGGDFTIRDITGGGYPLYIESGAPSASLRVDSSGNVGLRTSSPLAPLHVNNNSGIYVGSTPGYHLTLKATQTPAVTVGGSTITGLISTSGTGSASGHVGIEIPANDSNDGFYIATDSNLDGTVDQLAMKINAAGQVGINFNDPRATLDVHGSMRHITGTLTTGAVNGIKWNFTCTNTGSTYNDTWLLAGTVNIAEGNYKAASIHYTMQYPENNFGNTNRVEEYRGLIRITRTTATSQDDPADAVIYGADMSPVELRVYKVSAGVYEIQVKNTQANKYFSFDFMQTSGSGGIDVPLANQGIDYYAGLATLTGGTEYTIQRSSANLGMRQIIDAKNIHASEGIYLGGINAANLLDDYEEGTFTPTLIGSTSGSIPFTASNASFTKIGNVVTANIYLTNIDVTSSTAVGDIQVSGLPFNVLHNQAASISFVNMFTGDPVISAHTTGPNSVTVKLRHGSSNAALTNSDLDSGVANGSIMLTLTYMAA